MGDNDRLAGLDDPQLKLLVPLLEVVWSDGDLSAAERRSMVETVAAQGWLRPAARALVLRWLEAPPDARERAALRARVEAATATLSVASRQSIARAAESLANTPAEAEAVRGLYEALGLAAGPLGGARADDAATAARRDEAAVSALRTAFDGDHAATRARVRAFLSDPTRRAYGLDKAVYREKVLGWVRAFADAGFAEMAFPGVCAAGDLEAFTVAFETLAHGDLSLLVKVGVQFGLFGGSLLLLGTARHHALLKGVARAETLGCFAMSEVGHGSNVASLETLATWSPDEGQFVLHTPNEAARKDWIGNAAAHARYATVFAQLRVGDASHGVHAFLVQIRDVEGNPMPGVSVGDCGHKLGLNGVDNGRLWFDAVRVPREGLLDRFAAVSAEGVYESPIANPSRRFFTMLGTLVGGRVCVGNAGVSAARAALAIAVRYATARRQFGAEGAAERLLLEYPTHRRRLLVPLAGTVVLHFAFEALRARYGAVMRASLAGETPDTRELEAEVAALKVLGSRHGVETVQACREACGGQGFLSSNRLADLRCDIEVFTTFEGDNVVLLQLVAKALLSSYKSSFEGRSWVQIALTLGGEALDRGLDTSLVATSREAPEHLRDLAWHERMLRHRASQLVRTAAARLRKRIGAKMPLDAAFLEVQEHLVAASEAYAERLAWSFFLERLDAIADAPTAARVKRLGQLYALALIERRSAWYLEAGYLSPSKARAVRKEVERLIAEVADEARLVVDAFGIPDACLAAPIAFFDPAHPMLSNNDMTAA